MEYAIGDIVLIRIKGYICRGVVVARAGDTLPYLVQVAKVIELWVGEENPEWLLIGLASKIRKELY